MASSQQLILGEGAGGVVQYKIERSLRFNSADSASLSRTPASASNRKTWTWSGWVKRSALSAGHCLFSAANGTSEFQQIKFDDTNNTIDYILYTPSGIVGRLITTQVFRDVSSWYHIVAVWDTANATAGNRMRLYVNGSEINDFSTDTQPTLDLLGYVNNTVDHRIGETSAYGSNYFAGYLTEINFIDGQALTPSSFGQTNSATGVWEPKAYSGSYGTNGFYLNFSDNSGTTSTTLGKDYSGNGNNWTPNNFSVTAGAGNDSLVDTPTPYGTDTGAGGEVRGNYCTLNAASPLVTGNANGNLQLNFNATNCVPGTIGVTTGKWYWEGLLTAQTNDQQGFGVANEKFNLALTIGEDANSWGMTVQSNSSNGKAQHNNVQSSSYATFANGDICMVAYDVDAGKIWFGRNGTWFNSGAPASGTGAIYTNLTGTIVPVLCNDINGGGTLYANFGQRPFAYTAPSGFKALCTQNLPTPTIGATSATQAGKYFNPVLYTGNSTIRSITGVGFQPDFVWIKDRSNGYSHRLADAVRGAGKELYSDGTNAETTNSANGYVSSFDSDGFGLQTGIGVNNTGVTYVAWNWKANGAGSSNTQGTITSTVSANTTAGFSIVTWTGTGASGTIGHGLGATPSMVIVKRRDQANDWNVWFTGYGANDYLLLNTTGAKNTYSGNWGSGTFNSTVFSVSGFSFCNASGGTYLAYVFAPVAGYSAFGSYTGNGSTDGPFVFTGFRPAFVLMKVTSTTDSWVIVDRTRSPYNVAKLTLFPNLSNAENDGAIEVDMLSNGFKLRTANSNVNASQTFIYAAFAEFPFKYTLAR